MKKGIVISFALLALASCKTKNTADDANLPKDISLKPENNLSQQEERQEISAMIAEIETLIATESCSNINDWKYAPIGSKPCGGPSSYIAYPEAMEEDILSKIEIFTQKQAAFNTKYQLMSDCAMVMEPSGIECVDGKAVLKSAGFAERVAE